MSPKFQIIAGTSKNNLQAREQPQLKPSSILIEFQTSAQNFLKCSP